MPILAILARLYIAGVDVAWRQFHFDLAVKLRKVEIPPYPFQHRRYWYPPYEKTNVLLSESSIYQLSTPKGIHFTSKDIKHLPYLMLRTVYSSANVHIFETTLALTEETKFIEEHRVSGYTLFPMTGYIEMALEAGKTLLQEDIFFFFFTFLLLFILTLQRCPPNY
jgi:acyl transferase domain-containing protein